MIFKMSFVRTLLLRFFSWRRMMMMMMICFCGTSRIPTTFAFVSPSSSFSSSSPLQTIPLYKNHMNPSIPFTNGRKPQLSRFQMTLSYTEHLLHEEEEQEQGRRRRNLIRYKYKNMCFQVRKGMRNKVERMCPKLRSLLSQKRCSLLKQKLKCAILAFMLFVQVSTNSFVSPVHANPKHSHSNMEPTTSLSVHSLTSKSSSSAFQSKAKSVSKNVDFHSNKDLVVVRGGGNKVTQAADNEVTSALDDLIRFLRGGKADILILLSATALIPSICKNWLKISPILGFLAAGTLLGPNMLNVIGDTHTVEVLGELGIVFFLFEMGVELSTERLLSMKKDVFGLGLSQFSLTTIVGMLIGSGVFHVPLPIMMVISGGLALSSSAFVLQLLKDKQELGTRHGRASFGVLLFQDLAVVPLLVITPLLAPSTGTSVIAAVRSAILKAAMALSGICFAGRVIMSPLFAFVSRSTNQEAFLSTILLTVLSMSFLTQGLGLSNTLGAFLAGTLLSETKYRYAIEADIAPFRSTLLALFFLTVGFEIDPSVFLSFHSAKNVVGLLGGIIGLKFLVMMVLAKGIFKLSSSSALQSSLLLAQGGEFAFVVYGMAKSLGILSPVATKLLLTSVALSMALTPALSDLGTKLANKMEESAGFDHYLGQDREAEEILSEKDYVVVVGYGTIGKVVTDLLDRKFIKYVGLEVDPNKAIQARNRGLPVFYGDVSRPEVAEAFGVGKASAVILTISEPIATNHAVISLRRNYPDLKIFARAKDEQHCARLTKTLNVTAKIPTTFEDTQMIALPFGGAVLEDLGSSKEEVDAILEEKRRELVVLRNAKSLLPNDEEEEEKVDSSNEEMSWD